MEVLRICRKCSKPTASKVNGKARSGRSLIKRLKKRDDLPLRIKSCKCLGHCKKGPNGILEPGGQLLNRLSVREVRKLAAKDGTGD